MSEHTQTPWRLSRKSAVLIEDKHGNGIAAACNPDEGYKQELADAAFIVRACNSHEALVAALEDLVETLDQDDGYGPDYTAKAHATLKLAKG